MFVPSKREECGLFGIYGNSDAAKLTYFGLYALQHRGQESAGIAVSNGSDITDYKGMGLVCDVFNENILDKLKGHIAVGHVRYSTTGSSLLANAQPFVISHGNDHYSIAHNGNLVNALPLRQHLEKHGAIFRSTMDTEIFMHLLAKNLQYGLDEALVEALKQVKGAYSLIFSTKDSLIGIRDPNGFRPLCLGEINDGYVLASETCALDLVGATYIRDIEPGEVLIINKNGLRSLFPFPKRRSSYCIFEFIYFARPDSNIFGKNVYSFRKRLGNLLVEENPVIKGDIVLPFPDSGNYAGIGFSETSKIPFEMGVIRNHYIGRTFIQPTQFMRDFSVRVKLNPVRDLLKGKTCIIIEDSIIRGTTTKTRTKSIREAGAKEVHMLVSCPPHKFPCHYGIDFSNKGELIAATKSISEICDFIGVDSLNYLSIEGLLKGAGVKGKRHPFCLACFDGKYPVDFNEVSKDCFEKGVRR